VSFIDIHDSAMILADEAAEARRRGDDERWILKLREAYRREEQAARLLEPIAESEPTRTILFRSASSMAFRSGDYQEACNLAYDGLSAGSPEEFAAELLDVLNDAKFRLQLVERNLTLVEREVTVSLRGPRVAVGLAPARQATLILGRIEKLLRGHVENYLQKHASTERPGDPQKQFEVFIRPLPVEEFAVAFRLALNEQLGVFGSPSLGNLVISDFIRQLQGVVHGAERPPEREKFASGVLRLEPDGKEVTYVEISALVADEVVFVRIPPRKRPGTVQAEGQGKNRSADRP
jgi:hypothetical protein